MSRIRGDPIRVALAHPTRAALYEQLLSSEEMSTVQLCKAVEVERYHLYHHLKHLVKVGLIENHRDVGRARWWRCLQRVNPRVEEGEAQQAPTSIPGWVANLDPQLLKMLENGATIRMVNLSNDAAGSIAAKKSLERVALENGIDFDLPFTFIPAALAVISRPR